MKKIVIGSRGSKLALIQTHFVQGLLAEKFPDTVFEIKIISTTGDKILDVPLAQIGDKALFTKELETAMLGGVIDMAVHSLKDLPTRLPEGLVLGAVLEREDVRDVFLANPKYTGSGSPALRILDLPEGAVIASGSLRRRSQLLNARPDLQLVEIRGNLDTRFKKLYESGWHGMILARAGIVRMGYQDRIAETIPTELLLPAVGQGAIGIEIREDDAALREILTAVVHRDTELATRAERAMLRRLEGGCQVPIGAHALVEGDIISLEGMIASLDGKKLFRGKISAHSGDPEALGAQLAEDLLAMGGRQVLDELRNTL